MQFSKEYVEEEFEWMLALGMMESEIRDGEEYTRINPVYRSIGARKFANIFERKYKNGAH
jgi:hypothetical protein